MTSVVAAVIERGGRILICQRNADGAHPLKWEFPGGKVEAGEKFAEALARELWEELRIRAQIGPEIARYEYAYPAKQPILLAFYEITQFTGDPENQVFTQILWADKATLAEFDFLEGDVDFVRRLSAQAKAPA
jgi:8-oxo-dGTP diphosphatase